MDLSMFALRGRVALVTGGSRGLGKAMARGLAVAGADVVLVSRTTGDLRAALKEVVDGTGSRGSFITADLSLRSEADRVVRTAVDQAGHVDILVNNAGMNVPQTIDGVRDGTWDQIVELNLSSVMALTRAVIPHMTAHGWGRIIHISSVMGFASKEGRGAYSSTKTALHGLARASAIELGQSGITVNCISPGLFLTPLTERLLSDRDQEAFVDRTALGRYGDPTELIGPLLLLASDAGSYITGTSLVVDGGYLAR